MFYAKLPLQINVLMRCANVLSDDIWWCCPILGGLQEISVCSFDHFENCGIVDKSSFASRWAIVAEDYILSSTSELLCCNIFCLIQSANTDFVVSSSTVWLWPVYVRLPTT